MSKQVHHNENIIVNKRAPYSGHLQKKSNITKPLIILILNLKKLLKVTNSKDIFTGLVPCFELIN